MSEHELIALVLFSGFFLFTSSMLHFTTKKWSLVPYTSALLLVGIISQILAHQFGIDTDISLTPNAIYFILLPLLLFESAMHINIHQFKLQFKTITFLATFGLMLSMFIIGTSIHFVLGLPLAVSLLFGTIISATDPIAVLSLFKSLGAPKRLGLIAEGESMFNDATAVIAFRTILTFAMATATIQLNQIAMSFLEFLYASLGSAVVGFVMGYIMSLIISKIDNDRLVETTLTISLALSSFVVAEHFLHLSGVITCVVAAITLGNVGRTKISGPVISFMEEFWEYLSFVAISLVFFFATFNLNLEIFNQNLGISLVVVLIMLIGRAISVYSSFKLSNTLSWFKNEPNVPLKWQHIINWGGMRGVIPLVLVYSLPAEFAYRQEFLAFTINAFLFTLFVNAISIRTLLMKLGIHLPKIEEDIIRDEELLLELEEAKVEIEEMPLVGFEPNEIKKSIQQIEITEQVYKQDLVAKGGYKKLVKSLRLQANRIERDSVEKMFRSGTINESIYFDLLSELDLQLDALEHPEVAIGRGYQQGGKLKTQDSFRKRLSQIHTFARKHPVISKLFNFNDEEIILDRIGLLKARILSSQDVIEHIKLLVKPLKNERKALKALKTIIAEQEKLISKNNRQLDKLETKYPKISKEYQESFLKNLVKAHTGMRSLAH